MVAESVDVLVVGGGNAGLNAALAARRRGAGVRIVESSSRPWRGGNTKYVRNLRCAHRGGDPVMSGSYPEAELAEDLARVSGEGGDPVITRLVVERSEGVPAWFERNGVRWQPALHGTLQLDRTNRFFLGGGKALLNALYATAEEIGCEVRYEHAVSEIEVEGRSCTGVVLDTPSGKTRIEPRATICAAGGFEANLEWLREYWGDAAENFYVRGSRANDGTVLRSLLDAGALARGDPRGVHAIAVDARGPRFEGGIVTRVDAVPFGIVVNAEGRRFYDEGEDLWPKRYAIWGMLIAGQPGQVAWSIVDSNAKGLFMSTAFPAIEGASIGELAEGCGIPSLVLEETVRTYNDAVVPGRFDKAVLDDCRTDGLSPPKSHWAQRIERPPYYAYPLVPGITFTYLGVGVEPDARIRRTGGESFENLFAAGELMAGNVLVRGYLAGFGITIGAVFGRIAGEEAAAHARG